MRILLESSVYTSATPGAVWAVWADPELRAQWHPALEWATSDGPLEVGAHGRWKSRRARRPVDVEVTDVTPGERLVLSGTHGHGPKVAQGHYEHIVAAHPHGGSRITHRMGLTGVLALPISLALGRMLAASATPEAVAAVARLAQAREAVPIATAPETARATRDSTGSC